MFKVKNNNTLLIFLSLITNKNLIILKNNEFNSNFISFKNNSLKNLPPVNLLTEINCTQAIDIAPLYLNNSVGVITNNVWYNFKWDLYINQIVQKISQDTNFKFNLNRVWLEREASELFKLNYKGLYDTRPLLLNYNDTTLFFNKNKQVQPTSELKANWHLRQILKIKNSNVEL